MSGASIEIAVNDTDVIAAYGRAQATLTDLTPINSAIGAAMVAKTQQRFLDTTGPDGAPWARLARRTAAQRVKEGRDPANILRRTNGLYASLTYNADAESVEWGTNVAYAATHQFGADIKREARTQTVFQYFNSKTGEYKAKFRTKARSNFARDVHVGAHTIHIPARPFLGIDDDDRATISEIVAAAVDAAILGNGSVRP